MRTQKQLLQPTITLVTNMHIANNIGAISQNFFLILLDITSVLSTTDQDKLEKSF